MRVPLPFGGGARTQNRHRRKDDTAKIYRGFNMSTSRFKRVLLKISGEALMGEGEYGIEADMVGRIAKDIK
jgi:hypothetical protein